MQPNKKITLFVLQSMLIFLVPSCSAPQNPEDIVPSSDPRAELRTGSVAERFKESAPRGPTAVESAIELSQKYARLSEEAAVLRQQNKDFIAENRRLKERAAALEANLQQAQKELTEANNLLRDMLIELNSWKSNVIGFREEIRGADKAQLETLLKILTVLGGEVNVESVQGEQQDQAALSAAAPSGSQQQETATIGEPNE
jgi:chromosome segregation ATPase